MENNGVQQTNSPGLVPSHISNAPLAQQAKAHIGSGTRKGEAKGVMVGWHRALAHWHAGTTWPGQDMGRGGGAERWAE